MRVNLLEDNILTSLIKLALPLVATAFVMVTYNIVDTIWLGRLGTEAVAASGIIGIYIWLANTIMNIPRTGVSIRASQTYGAKRYDKTRRSIRNSVHLAILLSLLVGIICLGFEKSLIAFYKLDPLTEKLALDYFTVIIYGMVFSFINPVLSSAYNSLGNSLTPFIFNCLGLVLNIFLDPILIFGLGPIPAMGIRGAALATVSSQAVVSLLFIIYIIWEKGLIYESEFLKRSSYFEMKGLFRLGLPTSLRSAAQALVAIVLNKFTAGYGSVPLAVFSVGSQVESISYMTSDGFALAITAFTGQNYGAEKYDRIEEMTKKSLRIMFAGGTLIMLAFIFFGEQIYSFFLPHDPQAISMGASYLVILGLSQALMNVEIGSSGVFNGIGKPNFPGLTGLFINILRIPISLILMPHFGVYGIWIAITISSNLKGLVNYFALKHYMKKLGI